MSADPWWADRRDELLRLADRDSPMYAYDPDTLRDRVAALRELSAFDRILYAMKANPHPGVLAALAAAGCGFECVSPGEVARARVVAPDAHVLYTPNFASRADLSAGFDAAATVTLDGPYPAFAWPDLLTGRDVFLRVDPGRGRGHHHKVRTAGAASKFGLAAEEVDDVVARLRDVGARVVGLHAHAGSGVRDVGSWRDVGRFLSSIARRLPDVRVLDVGGGLYVPDRPGRRPFDVRALGRAVEAIRVESADLEVWVEPGRYLVADAGVLLCRVTQPKRKGDTLYVGVDAGMHTLLRPALYGAWHEVVNLTRLGDPVGERVTVVGPICESGDVLARDRDLPTCHEGDVLLFARAGAYGAAMSSTYNLRSLPTEVLLPSMR